MSIFITNYYKYFFYNISVKKFNLFFYIFNNNYFYCKRFFSYTGKIFRLKLYTKKIKFLFNRSHRIIMYFKDKISIKKLSKKRFRIIFFYKFDMFSIKNIFNKIRNLNIYTHRGLKYSHCLYNKKKGKLSAYRKVM